MTARLHPQTWLWLAVALVSAAALVAAQLGWLPVWDGWAPLLGGGP